MLMNKKAYDFLLAGAGLFNAVFALEASRDGKRCLVIEKRPHTGGNLYCTDVEGITVHAYGPHIFHTSDKTVWDYMQTLCGMKPFINSPIARYKDKIYNLPFNMNTFYQLWGTQTPAEALAMIESQRVRIQQPCNLEEQALSMVGKDIYEKLIKGYTEKQWGMDAKELPPFIIRRLPLRFTYNNNYFNDAYQGIPVGGYNSIFEKCFADADILLNTDFLQRRELSDEAAVTVYTGTIDGYYNYCYGNLEYRSLRFETEIPDTENFQGNVAVNYTEKEIPYTRIIEYKHFESGNQPKTVITKEYPVPLQEGYEPFYPVNTPENNERYAKYARKASQTKNLYFAGRLGAYQYYDMDKIISVSIQLYNHIKNTDI